ncbi:urease accessory UreF family protein [Conexibacter stalactiti]|uniref:Urease accessory protein UreF n=1 Tax=Conexibacter stalactiti TaxID=1940611 RepID=A0ABU4HVI5_9ACTN|nr:urease accessory UreF family protein [Conexibacter stalactiti]MDW5596692.1 urease accessory UreF family protein [Conexibacter stalactiti]MEC5037334.1 urease accessory UreF family protein [Conexibacter stalactiti]
MSAVLSLLLADSRTPTGGYAHSAGLEPAVAAGLRGAEVPAFLSARLETVAFVDASFAAAACADARSSAVDRQQQSTAHADGAAVDAALAALLALDDELAARTPGAPQRAAVRSLGRALLRVAARLAPGDALLERYAEASAWTPRPVVFGAVAGATGLTPLEAARLSLYEDAAGIAAAAVKLLPLDAVQTTAWVAGLAPRIEALAVEAARSAAAARPPGAGFGALPATSTPLLDLRALAHERSDGRLFVS